MSIMRNRMENCMKGPSKRIIIYFNFLPVSNHSLQIRSQSSRFILATLNSDNLMGSQVLFSYFICKIFLVYISKLNFFQRNFVLESDFLASWKLFIGEKVHRSSDRVAICTKFRFAPVTLAIAPFMNTFLVGLFPRP